MSLVMSGLDCHHTPLALREKLAFSGRGLHTILEWLKIQKGVTGAVLLSTCNRTELYLTGEGETPWRLLCRGAEVEAEELRPYFETRTGFDAARHLMEVACGLHSQILGEDQIITQVRTALDAALEARSADSALAALFRHAVTAGKRAKTQVTLTRDGANLGTRCRDVLARELGGLAGRKILVIGNGQMGRLAAETLRDGGAAVTVTLRSYHHGQTIVPAGCATVAYENRIAALSGMDAVLSATTSPHYTLTAAQLQAVSPRPKVAVDLAVPRDIEPACGALLTYYDTDALGASGPGREDELADIRAVVEEELERFSQWQRRSRAGESRLRFPIFLDLSGRKVVLVGGGQIAARRIGVLRQFGCEITVISPTLSCRADGLTWLARPYAPGDLDGATLVIAATDDRSVNHRVGEEAKALGIPVSVADCEGECSFYFPAICVGEGLVAGVVSEGKDHHRTARAAKAIRKVLEELP